MGPTRLIRAHRHLGGERHPFTTSVPRLDLVGGAGGIPAVHDDFGDQHAQDVVTREGAAERGRLHRDRFDAVGQRGAHGHGQFLDRRDQDFGLVGAGVRAWIRPLVAVRVGQDDGEVPDPAEQVPTQRDHVEAGRRPGVEVSRSRRAPAIGTAPESDQRGTLRRRRLTVRSPDTRIRPDDPGAGTPAGQEEFRDR
jgi:hypothetical protein